MIGINCTLISELLIYFTNYFQIENCIVKGYAIQDYPGNIRRGYSTFEEAKFQCSTGIDLIRHHYYYTFSFYLKLNGKYFRYSVIYILGNACGGITFETDKQEWTLRWRNELVVSTDLYEKSILRSCYGKKLNRPYFQ